MPYVIARDADARRRQHCELLVDHTCDAIPTGEQRQLHKRQLLKGNLSYSVPVSGAHSNEIA